MLDPYTAAENVFVPPGEDRPENDGGHRSSARSRRAPSGQHASRKLELPRTLDLSTSALNTPPPKPRRLGENRAITENRRVASVRTTLQTNGTARSLCPQTEVRSRATATEVNSGRGVGGTNEEGGGRLDIKNLLKEWRKGYDYSPAAEHEHPRRI